MKILVTGGTGFIGSHTCVELLDAGYDVVIVDNLSNSKKEVVSYIEKITGKKVAFYENDVCDKKALIKIFKENKIDFNEEEEIKLLDDKLAKIGTLNSGVPINAIFICCSYSSKPSISWYSSSASLIFTALSI